MDYAKLKTDITTYASGLTDPQAIANVLNEVTVSVVGMAAIADVLIWAGQYGVTAKLQAHTTTPNDPLASPALSFLLACQGGLPGLDLSKAAVQAMVGSFVASGDVSADAEAALTALATTTVPYWQSIGFPGPVTAGDITTAEQF